RMLGFGASVVFPESVLRYDFQKGPVISKLLATVAGANKLKLKAESLKPKAQSPKPKSPKPKARSPHHIRPLRLDLIHDARLTGLPIRIFIRTQIFFGHFVDVGVGALLGDFGDTAANLEIAVRVLGIDDCEGHAWIAAHVPVLLPA